MANPDQTIATLERRLSIDPMDEEAQKRLGALLQRLNWRHKGKTPAQWVGEVAILDYQLNRTEELQQEFAEMGFKVWPEVPALLDLFQLRRYPTSVCTTAILKDLGVVVGLELAKRLKKEPTTFFRDLGFHARVLIRSDVAIASLLQSNLHSFMKCGSDYLALENVRAFLCHDQAIVDEESLISIVKSKKPSLRGLAARALRFSKYRSEALRELMTALLEHPDKCLRYWAIATLRRFTVSHLETFVRLCRYRDLDPTNERERRWAVRAALQRRSRLQSLANVLGKIDHNEH